MVKTILLLLFCSFSFGVFAQNFGVTSTYATQQGSVQEEIAPLVCVKNNTRDNLKLQWEISKTHLPLGWSAVVCDHQCGTALNYKKSFTLKPGEKLTDFKVNFRPNGYLGIGSVDVLIYEPDNREDSETMITFSAAAQNVVSSTAALSGSEKPIIYPNPAIDHIIVGGENNQVKFLEVYNVLGRKLKDFTVRHDGQKHDMSRLSSGMYMVRMLDHNGNIIRTQRITKNNP